VTLPDTRGATGFVILEVLAPRNRLLTEGAGEVLVVLVPVEQPSRMRTE